LADIIIHPYDATYVRISGEEAAIAELAEKFTFFVPGYKWNPKFKLKLWDGKIRLLDKRTRLIYFGLQKEIQNAAEKLGYTVENTIREGTVEFSLYEAREFIKNLGLPDTKKLRDYQEESFVYGVREERALFLSSTSSGKSLMIYLISRYFNGRTLIIVPSTNLVEQMYSNFLEYGCDENRIQRIRSGHGAEAKAGFIPDGNIVVTTWQSAANIDKKWFNNFDVLVGDEVHLFKAKELKEIVEACSDVYIRFGFTGTLDGTHTHKLVLSGLFGPIRKVISTREMIDKSYSSDLQIKIHVLHYPEDIKRLLYKSKWASEMDFLEKYKQRNIYLRNLALSLKGNTLVLFEKKQHGKLLADMIKDKGGRVLYIDGDVDALTRNSYLKMMETERGFVLVASFGTLSTGANIVNLDDIIFARPMKSRIRNLQSIGRGLRRGKDKTMMVLHDPIDDLRSGTWVNTTFNHGLSRLSTYRKEKFAVKRYDIKLGVDR
jgi:superfamily II DNA or RNA helicase